MWSKLQQQFYLGEHVGSFHDWDIEPKLPDLSIPKEEQRYLAEEELLETKPNRQVIDINPSHSINSAGVPFQAICNGDINTPDAEIVPIALYLGQWHNICLDSDNKQFYVGDPLPEIHKTDLPPTPEEPSDSSVSNANDKQNFRNISIPQEIKTPQHSPLELSTPHPTEPTMVTQTKTQSSNVSVQPAGTSGTTVTTSTPSPEDIRKGFNAALRQGPPGGGGGGGGSGGGGGGSGGGGGGPPARQPAAQPPAPIAIAGDVKNMGQLPFIFDGDRTKADDFIDEVKSYLLLNQDVSGFNSPIKKVAFTITLIKGPDTAGWTRDIRTFLEGLDPVADNVPAIWDQFLVEFANQFQDLQRRQRAKLRLETMKMVHPNIDEYISKFKNTAREAGYTQGDEATTHYFLKGLTPGVLLDCLKPPTVDTYAKIKERAIQSTRSRMLIENFLGPRRGGGSNTS